MDSDPLQDFILDPGSGRGADLGFECPVLSQFLLMVVFENIELLLFTMSFDGYFEKYANIGLR